MIEQKEPEPQQQKQHWHVGKEIPLMTLAFFVVQSVAVVWGGATIVAEVHANTKAIIGIVGSNQQRDREAASRDVMLGKLVTMMQDVKTTLTDIRSDLRSQRDGH